MTKPTCLKIIFITCLCLNSIKSTLYPFPETYFQSILHHKYMTIFIDVQVFIIISSIFIVTREKGWSNKKISDFNQVPFVRVINFVHGRDLVEKKGFALRAFAGEMKPHWSCKASHVRNIKNTRNYCFITAQSGIE